MVLAGQESDVWSTLRTVIEVFKMQNDMPRRRASTPQARRPARSQSDGAICSRFSPKATRRSSKV